MDNTILQLREFLPEHLTSSGPQRGFHLRAAYELYKRWCSVQAVPKLLGKTRFGILLEEEGFIRKERRDVVKFEGRLLKQVGEYPPVLSKRKSWKKKEVKVKRVMRIDSDPKIRELRKWRLQELREEKVLERAKRRGLV